MSSFADMAKGPSPFKSRLETLDNRVAKLLAKQFGLSELDDREQVKPVNVVAGEAGIHETIVAVEVDWLAQLNAAELIAATDGRKKPAFFKTQVAKMYFKKMEELGLDQMIMVFRWSGGGTMVLHNNGVPRNPIGPTFIFSDGATTLVMQHLERYLDTLQPS